MNNFIPTSENPASFSKNLRSIAVVHFISLFNENAFRTFCFCLIFQHYLQNFSLCWFYNILFLGLSGLLPNLLFFWPAGFWADRIPKRYLLISAAIMDMLVFVAGFYVLNHLNQTGWLVLLLILFLQVSVKVFYNPALYAMLPEVFPEENLQKANGWISSVTFSGGGAGTFFALLMFSKDGTDLKNFTIFLLLFALIGIWRTFAVHPVISLIQKQKERQYPCRKTLKRALQELLRTPSRILAALGENLFLSFGSALLLLLLPFCERTIESHVESTVILLSISTGTGFLAGTLLAGFASIKKVELGLVPFGAAGVAISLLFAANCHNFTDLMLLGTSYPTSVNWGATFWLFTAGCSGGLFIVPLRSYLQLRFAPEARGCALAFNNVILQLFMSLCNILVCLLCYRFLMETLRKDIPEDIIHNLQYIPQVTPENLIFHLGIILLVVTLFTMWLLPDFCLRFVSITLGHTFYRIRKQGIEHIPANGPALLLSNHISQLDGVLISSCTSRRVRFLLGEEYFAHPLLGKLPRLTGFIKVPSNGSKKEIAQMYATVKQALRNGEIICIFPEGHMSRNGILGRFKGGYEKMIPPDMNVPLIPIHIGGMWGSLFSHYRSKKRQFHLPFPFPRHVYIQIGKALPKGVHPFEVRQKIAELGSESAMETLPYEQTVHYRLAYFARISPWRVAMRSADNKEVYNYFQLFREAALLSFKLRKTVSSSEHFVGILLPNSPDAVISLFSTLLQDKIPCPLNYSISQKVFDISIKNAKIKHIITTREFLQKTNLHPDIDIIFLEDLKKSVSSASSFLLSAGICLLPFRELVNMLSPLSHNNHNALAVLLFSSGSTGNPKGVLLTHHNIYSDAEAIAQAITAKRSDKIVGNLPLFHSYGLNVCFWMPFLYGIEVMYVNNPLNAAEICKGIQEHHCTLLFSTPSFLQTYLRKQTPEHLASLRAVFTGAEKLRQDIEKKYHQLSDGSRHIVEAYGCTELSPVVTINLPAVSGELGRKTGPHNSIGSALAHTSLKIVDPITYQEVAPGEEGLLFVRGPMVMQGYLNQPELTQKALINGYYNTGDIAKMNEAGHVFICGRLSRFSKISGEMVPHEMVESIIHEICKAESRIAAVGSIADKVKGEVLAVLYLRDIAYTPEQIVEQMREYNIANLWIPKAVNFYPVDHLPMLGSGKLDLANLQKVLKKISDQRMAASETDTSCKI